MMGDVAEIEPGGLDTGGAGIELLVSRDDMSRATAILEAHRAGRPWCPRFGSTLVIETPPPWHAHLVAVLFLGLSPFWPPSKRCNQCDHQWG